MKKMLILAALVLAPFAVNAAEQKVCTGDGKSVVKVNATVGTDFVVVAFTPQCSVESLVTIDQNTTSMWGGSASLKGKNYFAGSTNGGAVKPVAACAGTSGCVDADVVKGVAAAKLLGSS